MRAPIVFLTTFASFLSVSGLVFAQTTGAPAPPYPPPPAAPPPAPLPPNGTPSYAPPPAPSYAPPPAASVAPPGAPPADGAASEDRDAPAAGGATALPFYRPTADELALAPPRRGAPFMLTLLEDTHAFAVGSIRGVGSETRLRLGTNQGFTIGTFDFNTFGLGYDAFRYRGVPLGAPNPSGVNVYILLPNLDIRTYIGDGRFGAAFGTSLTGVRVAGCALTGCVEASLRVLTVNAWAAGDFHDASFDLSLGASLAVGMKL